MNSEMTDGILTPEGKKELEAELNDLLTVERPKNKEELALARSQGDLSENADYDAARNRQAEIEGRIKQINYMLDNYKVVEKNSNDKKVQIGSTVTVERLDKKREIRFTLVGTSEVDLSAVPQRLGNDSPLGKACIGHTVGEEITVSGPVSYKIKIKEID